MSEETATVENTQEAAQAAPSVNPFLDSSWTDAPAEQTAEPVEETKVETVAESITETKPPVETKTEPPAEVKTEPTTKEEQKFANEKSERLYKALLDGNEDEVFDLLATKRELAKLDKMDAKEILKLQIKNENKQYTKDDIEDILDEKYSTPKKPVQKGDELDEEFAERTTEWQQKVEKVERRISRDSLKAKEELSKLNAELVLPDIAKGNEVQDAKTQQEELQKFEAVRNNYLKTLESDFKNFGGYEVKYKDEEVEIPVSFAVSPEEQLALKEELKTFDVDGFITGRWFNKDGSPNITQLMSDVTLLRKKEDVLQKVANEIGTKMREHYIGIKSKVAVKGSQNSTMQPNGEKTNLDTQIEYIWKNS